MDQTVSGIVLYFKFQGTKLIGIRGGYVDDCLLAGNEKF